MKVTELVDLIRLLDHYATDLAGATEAQMNDEVALLSRADVDRMSKNLRDVSQDLRGLLPAQDVAPPQSEDGRPDEIETIAGLQKMLTAYVGVALEHRNAPCDVQMAEMLTKNGHKVPGFEGD